MDIRRVIEIEQIWAAGERRIVDAVARLDPGFGSMTFDVADGVAVLAGPGLYVNQVMGAGLVTDLTGADLDHLEEHAVEVGVAPTVDVCDATRESVVARLRARGYGPDDERRALIHTLGDLPFEDTPFRIDAVGAAHLGEWQEATAAGWGHVAPDRRAASDLYAAAAHEADEPGLLLARDEDGRVVGAAMLRIDGAMATLGGMSTRPEWRGRGVQTALVLHRLRLASAAGCGYATSTVVPGGGSLRNLMRLGFEPSHTRVSWTKS